MDNVHPLRAWRLKKGWQQAVLGERVGVGASQISQIENGVKGCSLDVALKIKTLTGIPIESLTRSREAAQ